jgi:hypothetical protein
MPFQAIGSSHDGYTGTTVERVVQLKELFSWNGMSRNGENLRKMRSKLIEDGLPRLIQQLQQTKVARIDDFHFRAQQVLPASDHQKALAWITTQGLKLPRRIPEVTVAPEHVK